MLKCSNTHIPHIKFWRYSLPLPLQDEKLAQTHKLKLARGWKRVATLLTPEEHRKLKLRAVATGEDMSDILRGLVLRYLEEEPS